MTGQQRVRIVGSLREIAQADWDACAHAPPPASESLCQGSDSLSEVDQRNPFISYAFLLALEESGCVGGRTGWTPAHVIVESEDNEVLAVAPSYLKTHSQGEYVFDHAWAEAYERAGGRYYPKVQVSAPFTPATGPRLLVKVGRLANEARRLLIAGLDALRRETRSSSVHVTFTTAADSAALTEAGYLPRTDIQFHWLNRGYATYDDFLGTLVSRKRKTLKRERREAVGNGISIVTLSGSDLNEDVWDAFFGFYEDTGARKWGRPYLNRAFFSAIGKAMPDQIVLIMARRADRYIAGAINFCGANTLYGRNWGCIEDHPFLHFEVCYHRAIDYAIAHGLTRVEAGAQGVHKLARGYEPVITRSMHAFADPGLKRAVADYLIQERAAVSASQDDLSEDAPFRQAHPIRHHED